MNKEKGFTIPLIAMMMFCLIGFAALAIDCGLLFDNKTQLDTAVDAAALAGAYTFQDSSNVQPSSAQAAAKAAAAYNKVMGAPVVLDDSKIVIDVGSQMVNVRATIPVSTAFAKIFRISVVDISSKAAGQTITNEQGTKTLLVQPTN